MLSLTDNLRRKQYCNKMEEHLLILPFLKMTPLRRNFSDVSIALEPNICHPELDSELIKVCVVIHDRAHVLFQLISSFKLLYGHSSKLLIPLKSRGCPL